MKLAFFRYFMVVIFSFCISHSAFAMNDSSEEITFGAELNPPQKMSVMQQGKNNDLKTTTRLWSCGFRTVFNLLQLNKDLDPFDKNDVQLLQWIDTLKDTPLHKLYEKFHLKTDDPTQKYLSDEDILTLLHFELERQNSDENKLKNIFVLEWNNRHSWKPNKIVNKEFDILRNIHRKVTSQTNGKHTFIIVNANRHWWLTTLTYNPEAKSYTFAIYDSIEHYHEKEHDEINKFIAHMFVFSDYDYTRIEKSFPQLVEKKNTHDSGNNDPIDLVSDFSEESEQKKKSTTKKRKQSNSSVNTPNKKIQENPQLVLLSSENKPPSTSSFLPSCAIF